MAWWTPQEYVSAISALTALVAVVQTTRTSKAVAKMQIETTLKIAQNQILATTVSASRQKWIEQLRTELASFLNAIFDVHVSEPKEARIALKRVHLHGQTISLLINPDEPLHIELHRLLEEGIQMASYGQSEVMAQLMEDYQDRVLAAAQKVLKAEWKRVKTGETGLDTDKRIEP